METKITDGKINLKGNLVVREKPKKADYVLYLNDSKPIAIVEAKDNKHTVSYGIQQAITYAQMLDVPFAFSSNGDAFYEHDMITGQERQIDLDKFPSPTELLARYQTEQGVTPAEMAAINQPYYTSQTTYSPRYYQRNAINRTVEAVAKGQHWLRYTWRLKEICDMSTGLLSGRHLQSINRRCWCRIPQHGLL